MKRKWTDKKVLILGLSKRGIAAAEYLNEQGASCYITEAKPLQEKDIETVKKLEQSGIKIETGGHSSEFINDSYIAITSPGIPPSSEIFQKLKENMRQALQPYLFQGAIYHEAQSPELQGTKRPWSGLKAGYPQLFLNYQFPLRISFFLPLSLIVF